ncbi:hypothetical protein CR513_24136, partial [Mucuna pruriens]
MPHNVDEGEGSSSSPLISIFNYPGHASVKSHQYYFEHDMQAFHMYVLQNYEEVEPYLKQSVWNCSSKAITKIQAKKVYYMPYPEGHCDWLTIIKIKTHSEIMDNIFNQPNNEAPCQDVYEV